jgi:hypothetical protein
VEEEGEYGPAPPEINQNEYHAPPVAILREELQVATPREELQGAQEGGGSRNPVSFGVGLVVGLSVLGGLITAGFWGYHSLTRDSDIEDIVLGTVRSDDNAPGGTVKLVLFDDENANNLVPSTARLVDSADGNALVTELQAVTDGGLWAEGKWTIAEEPTAKGGTKAVVTFKPSSPSNRRPPKPIRYLARSAPLRIKAKAGKIIVTYQQETVDRPAPVSGKPVAVSFEEIAPRGPYSINLGERLERGIDLSTFEMTIGNETEASSITVADRGTWSFDRESGILSFVPADGFRGNPPKVRYTIAKDGVRSDPGEIAITYRDLAVPPDMPLDGPIARDDIYATFDYTDDGISFDGDSLQRGVTLNVLRNDVQTKFEIDQDTLQLVTVVIPEGVDEPGIERLDEVTLDGRTTGFREIRIVGQGTWFAFSRPGAEGPQGRIAFSPEDGFDGAPYPVIYTVSDVEGNRSNPAMVVLDRDIAELVGLAQGIVTVDDMVFWSNFLTALASDGSGLSSFEVFAVTEVLEAALFNGMNAKDRADARRLRPAEMPFDDLLKKWVPPGDAHKLWEVVNAYVAAMPGVAGTGPVGRYLRLSLMRRAWRSFFHRLEEIELNKAARV